MLLDHCAAGAAARSHREIFLLAHCYPQCMFDLSVASPATTEAVMNACVALAAVNADASTAVATSVIMEHIGALWKSEPSSPASAAGAAICQMTANMVPSACDALVQAGFSVAAASAAARASDPECYLKLLLAFASDDSCVELMIGQIGLMQHLAGDRSRAASALCLILWDTRDTALAFRSPAACPQPHFGEDSLAFGRRHVWSRPSPRSSALVSFYLTPQRLLGQHALLLHRISIFAASQTWLPGPAHSGRSSSKPCSKPCPPLPPSSKPFNHSPPPQHPPPSTSSAWLPRATTLPPTAEPWRTPLAPCF